MISNREIEQAYFLQTLSPHRAFFKLNFVSGILTIRSNGWQVKSTHYLSCEVGTQLCFKATLFKELAHFHAANNCRKLLLIVRCVLYDHCITFLYHIVL